MANTQINITENGTKTLATAGKYCDRNIDVNVNVAPKPTQFTNLYNPAEVTLQTVSNASSSLGGWVPSADKNCNYVIIPYHKTPGDPFALRMRGIGTIRDRMTICALKADKKTPVVYGQTTTVFRISFDEYGDAVMTLKGWLNNEWFYFVLNFQYIGVNSGASEAFTGPIITINEPIGNGGYTG